MFTHSLSLRFRHHRNYINRPWLFWNYKWPVLIMQKTLNFRNIFHQTHNMINTALGSILWINFKDRFFLFNAGWVFWPLLSISYKGVTEGTPVSFSAEEILSGVSLLIATLCNMIRIFASSCNTFDYFQHLLFLLLERYVEHVTSMHAWNKWTLDRKLWFI